MNRRIISLLLALVMVFTLCPVSARAEQTPVTVTIPGTEHYAYAAEVFSITNTVRSNNGLGTLTRNATLTELAMQRAAEIAIYFSHTRPDGQGSETIVSGVYTGWKRFGENIAIGQGNPTQVMEEWMNSDKGHREAILKEDYTQVGVGCFYADGVYCWVQLFGNSTTNTATTSATENVPTTREISVLPSNLDLNPVGEIGLELEEGQSITLSVATTNPEFPSISPALMLPDAQCTRSDGTVVATGKCASNGEYTVTAQAPGSGILTVPVYAGQPDALALNITVPGEVPTETTEPVPTETQHIHTHSTVVTAPTCTEQGYTTYTCTCGDVYTSNYTNPLGHDYVEGVCSRCEAEDPDYVPPTEPEPTETEPEPTETEPEPTDPEPTDPEPTDPEPTDPEPTDPEPTDPEPTDPEPTDPEPTDPEPTDPEPSEPVYLASGICGDDIRWDLDLEGVLIFSGTGPMYNYQSGEAPWYDYRNEILAAVVSEGITTLGNHAFFRLEKLENVLLPGSLNSLGDYAFYGCTKLTAVELPEGLKKLPFALFQFSGLEVLEIPESVTTLEGQVFYGCDALEFVVFPDSVVSIAENIFSPSQENVTIHTYELSFAHLYAESQELPVVILEEKPDTVFYNIYFLANDGGTVSVAPESSPANRFVFLEVAPDQGYHVDSIYYYCNTQEDVTIQYEQISDTMFAFFMPACEVGFEITFVMDESPFTDVSESAYYYEPVLWAVSNGITSGISQTRFGPGNACTRAQVVTFLWRAANSPEPVTTVNPFSDVKETDFYYKAVLWAVENGITSGISETRFGPNNVCTRAQVVTFLWRVAQSPDPVSSVNPFADVSETSYYYNAVLWAVENGITSGISETSFGSGNTCTRAHVVTFLYKAFHG